MTDRHARRRAERLAGKTGRSVDELMAEEAEQQAAVPENDGEKPWARTAYPKRFNFQKEWGGFIKDMKAKLEEKL